MPFNVVLPRVTRLPILLSIPHSGIQFPDELRDQYNPRLVERLDDTDWFVDRLYDFAPDMGITIISSVYHRWVVDLNRAPDDKPLYADGRIITGLCPSTDFLGQSIYVDERMDVKRDEVKRRLELYYHPYHDQLKKLIQKIKDEHGKVLLWECHSIKQYVPTIYPEKFPDLILGDSDGMSASPALIKSAYDSLKASNYSVSHNYPFKGGYITREYGKPLQHQHALQLEMSKINYMDDKEIEFNVDRADRMRKLLQQTLSVLGANLQEMN